MAKKKNNKKVKVVKKMQDKSPETGEAVEDTVASFDQKDGNAKCKSIDDEDSEHAGENTSINTPKSSISAAASEESGQETYEPELNADADAKDVTSLHESAGITGAVQQSIEGETSRPVEKSPAAVNEDVEVINAEGSDVLNSEVTPNSIVESSKEDELNEVDLNESLIEVPADSLKVAEVHVDPQESKQYYQQRKTSPMNHLVDVDQSLEDETSKIEKAIDGYTSPPLPPRDHKATANVLTTPPSTPRVEHETTPAASQSPISPPLPPRRSKNQLQRAVPPPLAEEMQSEDFRRNLALANAPSPPPKQSEVNKVKQLDSAAEINLIVNRFRQTSHHYQRQDEASRENLERGKDFLKSSYSTFLESLEPNSTATKKITIEDHEDISTEAAELQEDEIELIKVDWAFWTQVVNDFPSVASYPEKLEQKITDGIPPQIRGIIWQLIANSKSKEFEDIYKTLLPSASPHEVVIRRDLKRTKYIPEDKIEDLFNIMKVYSVYDPDVGYTQGMAFIATPLLLNCESEAEAFGLLIRLMKSYGLRELFLPDMPGLMLLLYQFDRLFEENSPQLYNHLTRQGVRSSMYATQWFLTFFAYKFPLGFVLRIYDIVFVEGIESILRFAVNLMLKNEKFLVELNFDKLLDFLKNQLFGYYLKDSIEERNREKELEQYADDDGHPDSSDANSVLKKKLTSTSQLIAEKGESSTAISDEDYDIEMFVHDAMNDVHVTPISLKRYAAEYDEIHEIEQQKEAQYESNRIKNHQLQKEVRKLEHDYTLLNREHIEIANELIKNRLKIETLIDENNDQKLSILDLKRRLEEEIRKQELPNPDSSIPSDLKQDLNRTIKRNAEVMSDNLKLQDKVGEQERIIAELRSANRAGVAATFQPSLKPPLANGWSGLKKVFK